MINLEDLPLTLDMAAGVIVLMFILREIAFEVLELNLLYLYYDLELIFPI